MTTQSIRNSIGRSPLRLGLPRVQPIWIIRGFLLIPLALAWFALSPTAEAALDPTDTAYGTGALSNEAGGYDNSAFGFSALFSNTTGFDNTANGAVALYRNTTGAANSAVGYYALFSNTTGNANTATGDNALVSNTTGNANTATGVVALYQNSTGNYNTANGYQALYYNTVSNNTAYGANALYDNTTGSGNTASGVSALFNNTTGSGNTANGVNALHNNTIGGSNTATGFQALFRTTGSNNIGLGVNAGSSLTSGNGNVCIGAGLAGVAGESNTTRIKNVYASRASGRAVYVNSDNKIGTLASSRRFKDEIKPMDKASQAILALKPVTFRYKKEIEPNGGIMFGLIAEEVEQVDPDLVTRDAKGEAETVRYDAVNAMLLNEFLKEHRTVQELKSTVAKQEAIIAQQHKGMEAVAARLEEQDSKIQKVCAQLELSKPAPKTVVNNR